MISVLRTTCIALALLALAACDSAEERAAKHYQSGLELLEAGDVQRAMVEFRNVFALDGGHRDARLAYAKAARSVGNLPEAYGSYLRVAEQYPDDIDVRFALTEMAVLSQNWEEAERHGQVILAAGKGTAQTDPALLALEFRKAVLDRDQDRIAEMTRQAEQLAQSQPDNEILHRILIEGYLSANEIDKAVTITDRALAKAPDNAGFWRVKSMLLARKQDLVGLEAHLRATIEKFPQDGDSKRALIQLLTQQGLNESAEEFLRSELDRAEDKSKAYLDLIVFLRGTQGNDAALAELDRAIEASEDDRLFQAMKAGILFESGRPDEGIAMLQGVVDASEPSGETDRYKVTLAKMLANTGNEVGARQLIEQVLEHDQAQVDALKMSAQWMIQADETDQAIAVLRRALDQEPEDAGAMTLMAEAYQRAGEAQLAQDLLALAVEASDNAPAESLRFARVMMVQKKFTTAENTLVSALRRDPGNVTLLTTLGQVYLEMKDWARAKRVEATLRRADGDVARSAADNLMLQIIGRSEGRDAGIEYLEGVVSGEDTNTAATVALIRARLAENREEEALALAQELADKHPDDTRAALVLGNTQIAVGQLDEAETTFRAALEQKNDVSAALQYARVLAARGDTDGAIGVIDTSLEATPGNPELLWAKASFLERAYEIDAAIEIYESLYAQNSSSLIVANNLASLLATYRDDQESLDRAFSVARRLNGTSTPAFQDTYGWIMFRRGQVDEALTYMEPAAQALAQDPIVQFHLGEIYNALGRTDEALTAYTRAVEIAGKNDPRAQIARAVDEIERLSGKAVE